MGQDITTKPITSTTPTQLFPNEINWRVDDFEKLINTHGYEALIDRAFRCPCADKVTGQGRSTCTNCGGKGWFFVDRVQTVVVSQSMNNSKKFQNWSELNNGIAKITTKGEDKLGFMDRIILTELVAYHSEILRPIVYNDKLIAYPIYEPIDLTNAYLFIDDTQKLAKLEKDQYVINKEKIEFLMDIKDLVTCQDFTSATELDINISVRYSYHPVYHVIDANRELMRVKSRDFSLERDLNDMPINVLCKKAHYIFDAQKFEMVLQDNSEIK